MFWLSYERWDFADFGGFWYSTNQVGGRPGWAFRREIGYLRQSRVNLGRKVPNASNLGLT